MAKRAKILCRRVAFVGAFFTDSDVVVVLDFDDCSGLISSLEYKQDVLYCNGLSL